MCTYTGCQTFHDMVFNHPAKSLTDTETTDKVEESVVSRTVRQKKRHIKTNTYPQLTLTNDDTHEMLDEKAVLISPSQGVRWKLEFQL